jgi:acyl-CoA thioesterase-1
MITRSCIALLLILGFASTSSAAGVVVLGDSLSAAYGVPMGQGWVDLLAARLQQQQPQIVVVNASVSGDTTQGGITRIRDVLARHQPDVMILELGGNDALRGLLLDRTKQNLATMITIARDSGAKVLLLGMQIPPNFGPTFTKRFAALYRQLHEELNVAWVPFFMQDVALNPELMQKDGIHPTTAAQPQLLDNVWPALQTLLDDGA